MLDFGELYTTNKPALLASAERILHSMGLCKSGAEDALHQAMLNAINQQHTFRGDSSPLTWLNHIVRNECYTQYRRRRRDVSDSVLESFACPQPGLEEVLMARDQRTAVNNAMRRLSPKMREAIRRQYWDDMTFPQQATAEGTFESTVKTRAARGKHRLRKQLAGILNSN